jgi:uncharacterized protein (DUF58 family)
MRRLLFPFFKPAFRIGRAVDTRLTATGKVVAATCFTAALFGLDTRQTLAYQLAVFCLLLLIVSCLWSLRFRPSLTVKRQLPAHVSCGQAARYTFRIENRGGRRERDLVLRDCLLQTFPDFDAFRHARVEERRARNRLDRMLGYPRWLDVVRHLRGADLVDLRLAPIGAGTGITIPAELVAFRRGEIAFSHIELLRPDPLGLCYARHRMDARGKVLALPALLPVPSLPLHSRRRYQLGGVNLAASVGDSQEFTRLREYRPGDALRHIHWRSWAKLNQPIVKEYQDEYYDRHTILVDTFVADLPREILETSVTIAASFAASQPRQDSLLDLVMVGRRTIRLTSGRGVAQAMQILTALALVDAAEDADFDHLADAVRAEARALSSALCVLGRWDERRRKLVGDLRAKGVQCLALVVSSAEDEPAGALQDDGAHFVRCAHVQADLARLRASAESPLFEMRIGRAG